MECIYTLEVPDQPNKACMERNSLASVLAISWQNMQNAFLTNLAKMEQRYWSWKICHQAFQVPNIEAPTLYKLYVRLMYGNPIPKTAENKVQQNLPF